MITALKNILLVEDNPGHAELIMRAIEGNEIPTHVFHLLDGSAALEYIEHTGPYEDITKYPKPDLILLDLRLPRVNGLDVLKQIKTSRGSRYIPVVILTTSDAEKDIAQAYDLHANSYMVKPMDFEKFISMLDQICAYWLLLNQVPKPEQK